MANSEQRLHSVLATLEDCRAVLIAGADSETAHLVSVAILQLQMKINRITESELKALCDAMTPDDRPAAESRDSKSRQGERRRGPVLLNLVK